MMKPAGTWRKWIPIIVMVSWIYVASGLLQNAASATVKYALLGGVIGITEVLIGLSIAAGQVFPFAAGLIFLGTLVSSIPLFHAGSLSFPPDHWKIGVALAGSAALMSAPWIRRMLQRLSIRSGRESLDGKAELKLGGDSRDEGIGIMIRLDSHGLELVRKPRCIVTIRHPRQRTCGALQTLGKTSCRSEQHTGKHDHKLPFWIR
jgi:hypothetical protein